jgi:hypothetical protein
MHQAHLIASINYAASKSDKAIRLFTGRENLPMSKSCACANRRSSNDPRIVFVRFPRELMRAAAAIWPAATSKAMPISSSILCFA